MEETIGDWWMDASSKWHCGRPLPGWWQAEDGRWHDPDDYDDYEDDDPTGEIEGRPPAEAAHFAGGSPLPDPERGWGWPRWARGAVLASLAVVAIGVMSAAAMIDGGTDQNQTGTTTTVGAGAVVPSGPGRQVPQTTSTVAAGRGSDGVDPSASPSTERASDTTFTSVPSSTSPTSPRPSSAEIRPGAPCSPEGATAVTEAGVPLTCTVEKCHGAPFEVPRWRRATC